MLPSCNNRLTIVGQESVLNSFEESAWKRGAQAKYTQLLELSPRTHCWQFETDSLPPLEWMAKASLRRPTLTFVLEYDRLRTRRKGLAKARNGRLEHYTIK